MAGKSMLRLMTKEESNLFRQRNYSKIKNMMQLFHLTPSAHQELPKLFQMNLELSLKKKINCLLSVAREAGQG